MHRTRHRCRHAAYESARSAAHRLLHERWGDPFALVSSGSPTAKRTAAVTPTQVPMCRWPISLPKATTCSCAANCAVSSARTYRLPWPAGCLRYRVSAIANWMKVRCCNTRVSAPSANSVGPCCLLDGVKENGVSATVRNGVLEVRIQCGAAARPHNIDILDQNEPE